ncbi:hypothetical protein GCM10017044_00050 [Kordiimonas sediminis]|uniref:Aspartyl/asparaginy/proline hydroxylase domain-containing protein n=2 Tax=Kordiimonas sediminis TaxID=1735581 RepID=A0A919AJG1_9PROT|nr:hypothetical protein GCM10017044_00050 [Kordiimonas sediminis]
MKALQDKRPQEAHAAFKKLIDNGTENASIWMAIAYACRDMDDRSGCAEAVDKSLALEPRNPRAYVLKADSFYNDEDFQAATAFYLKAMNVAPDPKNTSPDLQAELDRAQTRFTELTTAFEDYLVNGIKKKADETGDAGKRISRSIEYMIGKKQPYFQQPKTYFFPELPNKEFYEVSDFDWVSELEAATTDILHELENAIENSADFSPYLTRKDNRPQSDPHGLADNDGWAAFYLYKDGNIVEKNAALCPKTMDALQKVPLPKITGRAPNVLFSRLRPGAKIPPHTGMVNTRLIGHLPLIIPPECGFRVGHDTREWEVGKVWLFDDTIDHEAWNNSSQDRYILLFEIWKPELSTTERELVSKLLMSVDEYHNHRQN